MSHYDNFRFSNGMPDEPEENASWTTGLETDVTHQGLIARGGYGEVHKVRPYIDKSIYGYR